MPHVYRAILCDDLPYGVKDLILDLLRVPFLFLFCTILVAAYLVAAVVVAAEMLLQFTHNAWGYYRDLRPTSD